MRKEESSKVNAHEDIILTEIRVVFDRYQIGKFDRTEEELIQLRTSIDDFEELQVTVTERILENTDIKVKSKEFDDLVQDIMYVTYLAMHFTGVYVDSGDFEELKGMTFKEVWSELPVQHKADVLEMSVVLEDTLAVVHGMYLLMAQLHGSKL